MKGFLAGGRQFSGREIVSALVAIIAVRMAVDFLLHGDGPISARAFFLMVAHTVSFFSLAYLLLTVFFAWITRSKLQKAATVLLFGFLFIITPPIFDKVISELFLGGQAFWSYYLFDTPAGLWNSFLTFFGPEPTNGITYGTRILAAGALIYLGIATYSLTKSVLKTLLAIVGAYIILFILGAFPSFVTYLALGFTQPLSTINDVTIAGFFLSPTFAFGSVTGALVGALNLKLAVIYIIMLSVLVPLTLLATKEYRKCTWIFLTNLRTPQIIYHCGLLFAGFTLALIFSTTSASIDSFFFLSIAALSLVAASAWISAVCFNDVTDMPIDQISNPRRPLVAGVMQKDTFMGIGIVFLILSYVIVFLLTPHAAIFLTAYHGLSWIYSMEPLRLKRFPFVSTFVAACASVSLILMGFTILSHNQNLSDFPAIIGIVITAVLTLILPIKDLKDIAGDAHERVRTLPVVFGEQKARLMIGAAIFISFVLSIFFFRQGVIFLTALICGTLSFWILTARRGGAFAFDPRTLSVNILLVAALFFSVLLYTLFL